MKNDIDYSLYGGAESTRPPRRTVIPSPSADDDGVSRFGPPMPQDDFLWLMTEEPHRSRRQAIMKAHPEVRKLMGYEPLTKYIVFFVVSIQVCLAVLLRNTSPLDWKFVALAYAVGGTANHNLFLAIHEITHNLAYPGIARNKWLAIFANLPIGIPYSAAFKGYHIEHHKFMGVDGIDTDLPTRLELLCLNNVLGKVFFATFQIFFYALRPTFVRSQKITKWHISNIIVQLAFDYILINFTSSFVPTWFTLSSPTTLGNGTTWIPFIYLLMSSFFAGSLHPLAGHFIAEHYLWDGLAQETYSYYGILNILGYNVGYHNEHHDFPSIPWTRLPKLRALAPEFYDNLPSHPSWPGVIWNFIIDPEVGIFARAKRLETYKTIPTVGEKEDTPKVEGKKYVIVGESEESDKCE